MSNIINTTDANFNSDVLDSEIPVLVDFWAEWCGPCKTIAPILEDLAEQYQGKVKIVKVNVSNNQELSISYGIRNIPALYMFKHGEVVAQQVGLVPRTQLAGFIEANL